MDYRVPRYQFDSSKANSYWLPMLKFFQSARNNSRIDLKELSVRGAPGEVLGFRFEVESSEAVEDLRVRLDSRDDRQSTVELFWIKRWSQAGVGVYQAQSIEVEELLVKDDRVKYTDKYKAERKNWRHAFNPLQVYCAPSVPFHDELRSSFKANESKSIYVRVKLPAVSDTESVRFEFFDKDNSIASLVIHVAALPISLIQPSHDFFIWFKGSLDWRNTQHFLSESDYRLQLNDIYDHGFTSISISEVNTEIAQKAIEIAEEIGFDRNLVLIPPYPELHKLKFAKAAPILYISDELDMHIDYPGTSNAEELIGYHKLNYQRANSANASTMSSLLNHTFIKRLQSTGDIGHCPGILSLYLNRNREYIQFLQDIPKTESKLFYYWQCFMEKPNLNRVLAGLYLWKSGAAGISPYCYQHMPKFPNSPFNDFDEWEPDFHESGINRPFKDHMTTYPVKDGVLATLQWEALRDGIADLKYLTTLHDKLDYAERIGTEADRRLASDIRMRTEGFLSRISLTKIDINSESVIEPYDTIDATEYDAFRNQIIDDLLLLTDNHASSQAHGR